MASSGKATIVSVAVLFVLALSMGYFQAVSSDDCDTATILDNLQACVYYASIHQLPTSYNDTCCVQVRNVQDDYHPSGQCMCDALGTSFAAEFGVTKPQAVKLITLCISASAVPSCMYS
jgi:hypothetical protein